MLRQRLQDNPTAEQRLPSRTPRDGVYVAGKGNRGVDDGGTGKHCRVLEDSQVDG